MVFVANKSRSSHKSGLATTYPMAAAGGSWAKSPSRPFMRGRGIELSQTLAGTERQTPIERVQRDFLTSTFKGLMNDECHRYAES